MISVDQIRAVLPQFLAGEITLDQFDEWIAKTSWDMQQDSSPDAISMVGTIELILSEYDSGCLSEEDARSSLMELCPVRDSRIASPAPAYATLGA